MEIQLESDKRNEENKYSLEKKLWSTAVDWLQLRLKEISRFYSKINADRGKHADDIAHIQDGFILINKEIVDDYNISRGLLALVNKEKGEKLGKIDKNTGLLITFSKEEKELKDQLYTSMRKEIFLHMLDSVERNYDKMQKNFCNGYMGFTQRDPLAYVAYLNSKTKNHHYARMLGLVLKEVYELLPELDKENYPVKVLSSLQAYNFIAAADYIFIPGKRKISESV